MISDQEKNEQRLCFRDRSQSYFLSTLTGNILRGFSYLVHSKYCHSRISSELESPVLYKIQVENSSFHRIFHSSTTALVTKMEKKCCLKRIKAGGEKGNFFY